LSKIHKPYNTADYEEWTKSHLEQCQANDGSVGKREVDAAIEMFSHFENLHSVKHVNYIGDGDSKTFKGIIDTESYKVVITCKKKCIDHVQKCMGICLWNLKKNMKSFGEEGKLTGKLIDDFTVYYELPFIKIRIPSKKWSGATFEQFDKCSSGVDCDARQRAKASESLHEYLHKTSLSQEIFNCLKASV